MPAIGQHGHCGNSDKLSKTSTATGSHRPETHTEDSGSKTSPADGAQHVYCVCLLWETNGLSDTQIKLQPLPGSHGRLRCHSAFSYKGAHMTDQEQPAPRDLTCIWSWICKQELPGPPGRTLVPRAGLGLAPVLPDVLH